LFFKNQQLNHCAAQRLLFVLERMTCVEQFNSDQTAIMAVDSWGTGVMNPSLEEHTHHDKTGRTWLEIFRLSICPLPFGTGRD
jgi:hypothetical protein